MVRNTVSRGRKCTYNVLSEARLDISTLKLMIYCTYISILNAIYYLPPSSSLHVSAIFSYHRMSCILLKLLHFVSKLRVACERDIS
jgi:hypothetical protein